VWQCRKRPAVLGPVIQVSRCAGSHEDAGTLPWPSLCKRRASKAVADSWVPAKPGDIVAPYWYRYWGKVKTVLLPGDEYMSPPLFSSSMYRPAIYKPNHVPQWRTLTEDKRSERWLYAVADHRTFVDGAGFVRAWDGW